MLESLSEGSRRVGGKLRLVGSVGMYVHSSIPCGIHPSVTIKHGKVGTVHGVLVGNAVGVTAMLASYPTKPVTWPEAPVWGWSPGADWKGQEGSRRFNMAFTIRQTSKTSVLPSVLSYWEHMMK